MQSAPSTQTLYPQYKQPDYPAFEAGILDFWKRENIFQQSIDNREGAPRFTFYEGPPSANGRPGVHHVMARTIKDLFCRYHTLKGKQVKRKAGWDTHGLPIELQVEKELGITKKDIGTKISVENYNRKCRETVMRFTGEWDELTRKMGYWVDQDHPYVTYTNDYIESVWHLLKTLHDQDLLYKGYTIQPYSPAAGTGLSSHELNMPGCYKPVKDTTVTAMFLVTTQGKFKDTYILAWTTTPWTLPANCALVVGENIDYVAISTLNPYTNAPVTVILAEALVHKYFDKEGEGKELSAHKAGDKHVPWQRTATYKGKELLGLAYAPLFNDIPLLDQFTGNGKTFTVLSGDFVTTDDGTGIVHTAGTFGADDFRVLRKHGVPMIMGRDENGNDCPIVDKQGKYLDTVENGKPLMGPWAGRYVKNYTDDPAYKDLDVDLAVDLKKRGLAFRVEKYEHNYPHCWRTDKPVLYYPLDSWFIRTSRPDIKQRMIDLNNTINWKPRSTGEGRFGQWLENLEDWNLSRSRYWGIPLPVWRNEDGSEVKCIGSVAVLEAEIKAAVAAGVMKELPAAKKGGAMLADLHKPHIDYVILADSQGRPMRREPDLIDVWFDSGAMPYAQWHYPFNNQEEFAKSFPADFIAEGVDQTRGWFFTLHAIAAMTQNSVAFRNVVSNGLVLDKNGNKMSKRLGNAVDPFETLAKYGADATRWYMVENAPPWENLKFNIDNLQETQRKFFGTLFNTYSFFALYANIDGWRIEQFNRVPREQLEELDRWILSCLYSLIAEVRTAYDDYDPTRAARAIEYFTIEQLSNWYVRLARRRFWKGDLTDNKRAAYETLQQCLLVIAQLMSPVAPFFAEWLYKNMTDGVRQESIDRDTPFKHISIHLTDLVQPDPAWIDAALEERMAAAQQICSLAHGIRKKAKINVRKPLHKLLVPVRSNTQLQNLARVAELIKSEINVKEIEYIEGGSNVIVKTAKANFKVLGAVLGAEMKLVAPAVEQFDRAQIETLEAGGSVPVPTPARPDFAVTLDQVEIRTQDIPGWSVAVGGGYTVALETTLTPDLVAEGIARELVNRIQNQRKDLGFEVTDKITVQLESRKEWDEAVLRFKAYICAEILATDLQLVPLLQEGFPIEIDDVSARINIKRL
jgi:isoleucyl-tRNA synthetase